MIQILIVINMGRVICYHSNIRVDEGECEQTMTPNSEDNGKEDPQNVATNFVN